MCKEQLPPEEPEMKKEQLPPEEPEKQDEEMPKEPEKQDEEKEDGGGLALLIDMTTKSILQMEMAEIASCLVDYRRNLAHRMLADENEDLFEQTVQYGGIATGIGEGWKVWKAGGFDRKKTSYEAFKQHIKLEEQ